MVYMSDDAKIANVCLAHFRHALNFNIMKTKGAYRCECKRQAPLWCWALVEVGLESGTVAVGTGLYSVDSEHLSHDASLASALGASIGAVHNTGPVACRAIDFGQNFKNLRQACTRAFASFAKVSFQQRVTHDFLLLRSALNFCGNYNMDTL